VVLGSLSPTIDGAGRSTVTIATTKRTATPSRCRRIGTSVPVCCGSIRTHEQTTSATIGTRSPAGRVAARRSVSAASGSDRMRNVVQK